MSKITLRDISENEAVIGEMNRRAGFYQMEQKNLSSVAESTYGAGLTCASLAELGQLFKEAAEDIRLLMQNYIDITWAIVQNYDEIDKKLGETKAITQIKR